MHVELPPGLRKTVAVPWFGRDPTVGNGKVDPGRFGEIEGEKIVQALT
jgi:hypothetical protein